jgi:hypothetical protein
MASHTERGVLDTSTVILLERFSDISLLPGVPVITAVTLAEPSVGPLVTSDPTRQARLQQAEAAFDPLPLTPQRRPRLAGLPRRYIELEERLRHGPTTP